MTGIKVRGSTSSTDGMCNACNNKQNTSGRVWVVNIGSMEVRLCDYCAVEMTEKLKTVFRRANRSEK